MLFIRSLFTRTVCLLWCHCAAHSHFLNGKCEKRTENRDGELYQQEKYFTRILQLIRNDYTLNPWNRIGSNKFSQKDFLSLSAPPYFSISILPILFPCLPTKYLDSSFLYPSRSLRTKFCLMYPSILASSIHCYCVCCCIQTVETNENMGCFVTSFYPSFFSFHCW